jgi:hypothetical protein
MEQNENYCQDLHDLLAGDLQVSWFSYLAELLNHWRHCERCQILLPEAVAQISRIESTWLFQIRRAIEQLRQDYDSEKQQLIREESVRREAETKSFDESHPPDKDGIIEFDVAWAQAESEAPSPEQRLHREFLILLRAKGEAIREQLEDMNDSAGLDYFRLVSQDGFCEYSSRLCGPLIASLPKETQNFVFRAILSADISLLFEDGYPLKSELAIHSIVERAAPGFLREYFESEKPNTDQDDPPTMNSDEHRPSSAVSKTIERLSSDLKDVGDSLKAGQMETIRILEQKRHQTSEIMEDLQNLLGKQLFTSLCTETRRYLQMGERYFRRGTELDDFVPSIHNFQRAFECEFGQRISRPLAQKLVQKGFNQYGLKGGRVPQLIQGGQLNRLGLGQQLSYLREDKSVREMLSGMGFEVDAIVDTGLALNKTRNKATHGSDCSHAEASRVRDIMLGPHSGFKALFSKRLT